MKEKMGSKGYDQGNMAPKVESYQKPTKDFSESGFSKTTSYIERKDAYEGKESNTISRQHYKGRYS